MNDHVDKSLQRIAAIDWMRGIVMILMALDHASGFFNHGRIFADSILLYESGSLFASDQFLTRWVTHICAPAFIFLTGASIAFANVQRLQQGVSQVIIDRELWLRGIFIAMLDIVLLSLASGKLVLQVLYAIGVSMIMMVWLRRLRTGTVLMMAIAIITGYEFLLKWVWMPGDDVPLWLALTFTPVFSTGFSVLYPAIPWLAIMMLGWVFGEWIRSTHPEPRCIQRLLFVCGGCAVLLFVLIRSVDDYGNMFMLLEGHSVVQWLHISKYPPSLAYTLLELGLMAVILAALMRLEPIIGVRRNGAVLVFGQTALFFYLAHFGVLALLQFFFERGGLGTAYFVTLLTLLILYPMCRIYRTVKWRNPASLLRFM
jgi:uncharacterized membrane protein